MKAIDFACRLLININNDDLSPAARLILLCVAGGINTSEELADFTGMTKSACTNVLRVLRDGTLLQNISRNSPIYILSPAGREKVRKIMDFRSPRLMV